jgi:hypothetical protein
MGKGVEHGASLSIALSSDIHVDNVASRSYVTPIIKKVVDQFSLPSHVLPRSKARAVT